MNKKIHIYNERHFQNLGTHMDSQTYEGQRYPDSFDQKYPQCLNSGHEVDFEMSFFVLIQFYYLMCTINMEEK